MHLRVVPAVSGVQARSLGLLPVVVGGAAR